VKTELNLGGYSEWIRVERDSALCELHNRDRHSLWVAKLQEEILCFCAPHFNLLPILIQVCSYLKFDLILGLIPRV
jgi:hypothetical protein